jgi:hypothetical protein
MANDDFRLKVTLGSKDEADELAKRLQQGDLEHRLDTAAGEHVIVSLDGDDHEVFLYSGTLDQAHAASDAVKELASSAGLTAQFELRRWHPVAEEWEDPDRPLPTDEASKHEEEEELTAEEDRESEEAGYAEYEIRIELPSHGETVEFAQRLTSEGIANVRRWKFILIGVKDEQTAHQLADRLTTEVPAGATVMVEGSGAGASDAAPHNPFRWFGGLGG